MTFLIQTIKLIKLLTQLVLLHHHRFIQNDQLVLTEWHDWNYFQNIIAKQITELL